MPMQILTRRLFLNQINNFKTMVSLLVKLILIIQNYMTEKNQKSKKLGSNLNKINLELKN